MNVVSNASPLINLSRIGQLALLPTLHQQITVLEAVWREVVVDGADQAGAAEIESACWINEIHGLIGVLMEARQSPLSENGVACNYAKSNRL